MATVIRHKSPLFDDLRNEARAEGRAEGEQRMLLLALKGRGFHVSDEAEERVMACTDTRTLERWFNRALEAETLDDVFTED